MNIVIVDDSRLARKELCGLVAEHSDCTLAGEASDVQSAIALINEVQPELLLLDINLPDGSGEMGFSAPVTALEQQPFIFQTRKLFAGVQRVTQTILVQRRQEIFCLLIPRRQEIFKAQMTQPIQIAQCKQALTRAFRHVFCAAHTRFQFAEFFMPQRHIHAHITRAAAMRTIRVAQRLYQSLNLAR